MERNSLLKAQHVSGSLDLEKGISTWMTLHAQIGCQQPTKRNEMAWQATIRSRQAQNLQKVCIPAVSKQLPQMQSRR